MRRITLLALALLLLPLGQARSDDDLEKRASWAQPTVDEVKAQVQKWLADQKLDELTQAKVNALWPAKSGEMTPAELLEQVATTAAVVHEPARKVLDLCQQPLSQAKLPELDILKDEQVAPLIRNNLRLLYGRWLAQHDLYDEALVILKGIGPQDVVDPASLLFYQSAGYHRLLDKENCLPRITRLLENRDTIPRRYATVAALMEADLKPLKTDSLDEIARLMDDIRRRLTLGRAGKRVRDTEDDVIAKLDKMIEEMEKKGGGGGGPGGGGAQSSKPAPDSAALGGKGPGNVDQKRLEAADGWGDLPPKERQAALQQITKELPAHYREVIEEYFRKLARDGGN